MKSLVIAINEQVCRQLDLTQEEQYAMIAHEIGHILDNSPREINNQLNREYNADQFAYFRLAENTRFQNLQTAKDARTFYP